MKTILPLRILKNLIFLSFIPLWLATGCAGSDGSSGLNHLPKEELKSLNAAILKANEFNRAKEARIDSVRRLLGNAREDTTSWRICLELSELYRQFNADSAIYYAVKAVAAIPGDDSWRMTRAALARAHAQSSAGIFITADETVDSVLSTPLTDSEKIDTWRVARSLNSSQLDYIRNHQEYGEVFRRRYLQAQDSLLKYLPADNSFRSFIACERLVEEGKLEKARKELERFMASVSPDDNLYAMAAYQLAEVHKKSGRLRDYAALLSTAAECDVRNGIKEGFALPALAEWLYDHGDIDNAFNYINFALHDANSANVRMRTVAIASSLPVIDEAYRRELDASNNQLLAYTIISTLLFIITAFLLVVLFRNAKKMKNNRIKLAATSRKLEGYVGNFIGLCSTYSSRLDQLTKLINRKISSGQSEELLKLVNSGRFADGETENFYKLIDKVILDIFPDFVETINRLLLPDKQIIPENPSALTPELRVCAFIRLGISQSTQIAHILGYSVNTVYAYRNRMRNRAIDREHFDGLVERGDDPGGELRIPMI